MIKKIFIILGVRAFKKIVEGLGKKFKRTSYFLESYDLPSLLMFKKTIRVNQLVHFVALLPNAILCCVTFQEERPIEFSITIVLVIVNGYLCLLQEYHLIRLRPLIRRKKKKEEKKQGV